MLIAVFKINTIFMYIVHRHLQGVIPSLSSFLSPENPHASATIQSIFLCVFTPQSNNAHAEGPLCLVAALC